MYFEELGLNRNILKAIELKGYKTPSSIQQEAIPAVLTGQDVMAAAQTGTGKTASFTLPIIQYLEGKARVKANQVRVLILTPTRELAAQVHQSLEDYSQFSDTRSAVVFGGVKINPQMLKLRKGIDVLVATPGRLLDLCEKNAVKLDQIDVFVLDEADRMLDMGFINDIRRVIALLPKRRQNLLFSATFSDDIRNLAKGLIHDPVEISVSPKNSAAKTVDQLVIPIDKANKSQALITLIKRHQWYQVLVFCRTKHGANKLSQKLIKSGIKAAAIHGNKSQGARTRALSDFKSGDLQALIATDIAARGIDIDQLPQVVNFDLPHVAEDYVHRIGRTGRAGMAGKAVSLVTAEEYKELVGIERLIQQHIPREDIKGFEAQNALPASPQTLKPIKAKKPKKNKTKVDAFNQTSSTNMSASGKPDKNKKKANNSDGHGNKSRDKAKKSQANKDIWARGKPKQNKPKKSSNKQTGNKNAESKKGVGRSPRKRPVQN
ncbi:DEAD/DEAH box helicase [Oleiphilus sp. HI0066]|uniref:DEAD/DEAH box helicase n=4 Tax=unclassified Oleiphilus TaxID=2631174 RepID=UPI0007C2BA29|nr:DEAD/DEAH box helicase [Oleiphilus sp. HI0066]KZY72330.1 RNA helicase [Oleiphilus sp. HI0066]